MGLDTSHNCWSGPYSSFMRWRRQIAEAAKWPPLDLMAGFYSEEYVPEDRLRTRPATDLDNVRRQLPISWDPFKRDVLAILLNHSDCDGEIEWGHCAALADRLEGLVPALNDREALENTRQFIVGLRTAHDAGESVEFH